MKIMDIVKKSFKENKIDIPFSLDAEKNILSAFLLDKSVFMKFSADVSRDDFYIEKNIVIYDSIVSIYSRGADLDIFLIGEETKGIGKYSFFCEEYVSELFSNVFSLGLFEQYLAILKEKSALRKIVSSASEVISMCYAQGVVVEKVVDRAEALFFEIARGAAKKGFITIADSLKSTFESISNLTFMEHGVTGLATGYSGLDRITCGMQNGDLIIVAARPSVGKTAFALCLARNIACKGISVGIFSLEMSVDQLSLRILSFDSSIPLASLRSGALTSEDWLHLTASAGRVSGYNIYIDDSSFVSILDLKNNARKMVLDFGVRVIFIDYLQLLHLDRKIDNRQYEVSEISRFLKSLAKELNIPIVALSQLSRGVESRQDKRPLLSDLRDSGAIEQDADLILFLYRDFLYNKDTPYQDMAEVIIGKHRNGPVGTVELRYVKEYTLFEDLH